MSVARYQILPGDDHWVVRHDEDVTGPYVTKEAAFEAAIGTAEVAMAEGHAIEITVPGGTAGRWAGDE